MKEMFVIKVHNEFFFFQAQTFSFVSDSSHQKGSCAWQSLRLGIKEIINRNLKNYPCLFYLTIAPPSFRHCLLLDLSTNDKGHRGQSHFVAIHPGLLGMLGGHNLSIITIFRRLHLLFFHSIKPDHVFNRWCFTHSRQAITYNWIPAFIMMEEFISHWNITHYLPSCMPNFFSDFQLLYWTN